MAAPLTVLRTLAGIPATKTWCADGTMTPYGRAKHFTVRELSPQSLSDLHDALVSLAGSPYEFVIRGVVRDRAATAPGASPIQRTKALFDDVPQRWLMVDVDGFEPLTCDPVAEPESAAAEYILSNLPAAFHGRSYVLQLSSSHGHPTKPGALHAHLWFWLELPEGTQGYTSAQLRAWALNLKATGATIDAAVYRVVQPHYTASPAAEPGAPSPEPDRVRMVAQPEGDAVPLVLSAEELSAQANLHRAQTARRAADIADPAVGWLNEHGWVKSISPDGLVHVRCPWEYDHGSGAGAESSTSYIPAGVGGSDQPGFSCLHDGCSKHDRSAAGFLAAAGVPTDLRQVPTAAAPSEFEDATFQGEDMLAKRRALVQELQGQLSAMEPDTITTGCEPIRRAMRSRILDDGDRTAVLTTAAERLVEGKRLGGRSKGAWIREVRKVHEPQQAERESGLDEPPEWLQGWCIEELSGAWIRPETGGRVGNTALQALLAQYLPVMGEDGARPPAHRWIPDHFEVPVVAGTVFMPGEPMLLSYKGRDFANSYRQNTEPEATPQSQWTEEQAQAVERVQEHFRRMLPNERERELLLSWLAHMVKHPGSKMLWAVHLAGVFGAGKSFVSKLMATTLGSANVGIARNSDVASQYNGWAISGVLVVLEELEESESRRQLVDAMKDTITNDELAVRRMRTDTVVTPNRSNYLATTNGIRKLPLRAHDRRWFVVQAEVSHTMAERWSEQGYFDQLFAALQHPGPLRQWLLDHTPHPEFNPKGRAPMTEAKRRLMQSGQSADMEAARRLLDTLQGSGCVGVSPDLKLLDSTAFFELLAADDDLGVTIGPRARGHLLEELGYTEYSERKLWTANRNLRSIWRLLGHQPSAEEWAQFAGGFEDDPLAGIV